MGTKRRSRARLSRMRKRMLVLAALMLLTVLAFVVAYRLEQNAATQERGVATQNVGLRSRVEYEGKQYVEKTGVTAMLLMGVDREEGAQSYGARQGGQADFLMLVAIDHKYDRVYQLQIDRDTMAAVEMLGVLGNPTGTGVMQIALSHGFGVTDAACCRNTLKAVRTLLPGADIDIYGAFDMNAMSALNNALGGVTVTLEDDMSALDPAMTAGTTLTLNDAQAELFVRSRMSVGDGTNSGRMQRQRAYLSAALDKFRSRMGEDSDYAAELYSQLAELMTTNTASTRWLNEINAAYDYEIMPIEQLPGRHVIGQDGFMEFHVEDGAALRWVMKVFFEPQDA